MPLSPQDLKAGLSDGLLSFPVTHFDSAGQFVPAAYKSFIDGLIAAKPAGLFAAGGTGEFFSLAQSEYSQVIRAAVDATAGRVPVVAGVGYGTAMAVEFARAAEAAGADGLLVLPQYLMKASQEGMFQHIDAICKAVKIGVVLYNRDNALYSAETVERLCDAHPNLIGFKDGEGNMERIVSITTRMGDRLTYIGGMPTAEVYALPYLAAGFTTYSSAVFNFIPNTAQRFYSAVRKGDTAATGEVLEKFFFPYLKIRNRQPGYAVSIVKAGLRVLNKNAGGVRSPLCDLSPAEEEELKALIHSAFGPNPN